MSIGAVEDRSKGEISEDSLEERTSHHHNKGRNTTHSVKGGCVGGWAKRVLKNKKEARHVCSSNPNNGKGTIQLKV